jgi:hypothetical protein
MWQSSLFHIEKSLSCSSSSYYTSKKPLFDPNTTSSPMPRGGDEMKDDEELEERGWRGKNRNKWLFYHSISCTYLLSSMISFHEKQFHHDHKRAAQQQKDSANKNKSDMSQRNHERVTCGLCGCEGIFLEKKVTSPRFINLTDLLLALPCSSPLLSSDIIRELTSLLFTARGR